MESQVAETVVNMDKNTMDSHLDDDKHPHTSEFVGATLEIGDSSSSPAQGTPDVEFRGPTSNFDRNRPGSTIGRQSVRSTTSRTSMKAGGFKSDKSASLYFCIKVWLRFYIVMK